MPTRRQLKQEQILQGLIGGVITITYPSQEQESEGQLMGRSTALPKAPTPEVEVNGYTLKQVAETMERLIEENNGLQDELRETKAALKRAEDINRELTNRENLE